jgi:glycosyltransferase involved in cell wall biosynthesis
MADIITTVSTYSERSIRKFLDIGPQVPIHIVPNGVADKFFEPFDRGQAKARIAKKFGVGNYILFVSRFEPRKNHNFLLKAWLDLRLYERDRYLVLLGHRSIRIPDFDETLGDLPEHIRRYIFLSDRTDDADLMDFYRGADVFVYPSKGEGFGIPPLEAAAMRTPVICSNSSAMAQFSFFGDYHIDPTDLSSFEEKLALILTDPPPAERLEAIAKAVHEQYSWDYAADKLWDALHLPDNQMILPSNP